MSKPTVAIFGLNGALGEGTIAAFSSSAFNEKFQLPILAVTRDASKQESTSVVKYVQGDIENKADALINELGHVDVVISLVGANPAVLKSIEDVVVGLKPKVYLPSQFGTDIAASDKVLPGFIGLKSEHSAAVRKAGIKVVDIYTGFFEGGIWLRHVIGHIGADTTAKTVTYLGAPETKLSFTNLGDIGRVVASVAEKAVADPKSFPDVIRVQSGFTSPGEVVAAYEKANNVKLEVKEVVSKEKALEEGQKVWAEGFDHNKFLYYLNVVVSQGAGRGLQFTETDNELVNPGESVWKWSKF